MLRGLLLRELRVSSQVSATNAWKMLLRTKLAETLKAHVVATSAETTERAAVWLIAMVMISTDPREGLGISGANKVRLVLFGCD